MKKYNSYFLNKFHKGKSSIIIKLLRQFLFTIIIPTILLWIIYLAVLNIYFINNTLSIQQTYLENSLSQLNLSFSNADNVFSSLESIPEIIYYLDVYSTKREMLYSLKKSIRVQCEDLRNGNASINSIKIYSNKPGLLYAEPFFPLDNIPLDDSEKQKLMDSVPTKILWHITPVDNVNGLGKNVPDIYAYQKMYAYNYDHVIGYLELKLNPNILTEYFNQFDNNSAFHGGLFTAYKDGYPIYSNTENPLLPVDEDISAMPENTAASYFLKNTYINTVTIPQTNLRLCITGKLSDLSGQPNNLLTLLLSLIICLLLILLIRFFMNIADLSRQILDFSTYIRTSNPDDLTLYKEEPDRYKQEYKELHHLINSYNNLIHENSTLISKVQKMELLSQDARYQALQAQIHPHFIYGTLENIRMLALQNRDRDVADMIFSLSALIRQSLSISSKAVTITDEIEIARHYLKIQKYRFGERLNYTFETDEALDDIHIPSFILQPILENSIIYGVSDTFDNCELNVSIYEDSVNIYIRISNTGKTITPERLTEINELLSGRSELSAFKGNHNGFALYNIKERLRIFYHGHTSIHMELDEHFTRTLIIIERSNANVSNSDC